MTKESTKENKPVGFKTLINVLRPIRDWLKNTPPINLPQDSNISNSASKHIKGSSGTINSSSKSAIVHTNNLLGNGTVEYNTHLMRHQEQQSHFENQRLYSQPIYRSNQKLAPPPPPLPRPAPIIGNQQGISITPNQYYSTTPVSVLNSNTSSTPISSSNNNNSSFRDDNSSYMMSNATMNRHTPIANGVVTMDHCLNGADDQFKRTARARMSLPIMQQNRLRRQAYTQLQRRGQHQAQSLGHIYLQHQGETKQASLPNELTALDTIRALFVCSFPNVLTMEYMSQPHVKIYIYNPSCNIFYELRDIDDVKHESVLRIFQSDPILSLPHHYQMRATSQVPPPKPRRMIPMNGLQTSSSVIYGLAAAQNNHHVGAPLQFQHQIQQLHSQSNLPYQPVYSQTGLTLSQQQHLQLSRQSMLIQSQHSPQRQQQSIYQPLYDTSKSVTGPQACLQLPDGT